MSIEKMPNQAKPKNLNITKNNKQLLKEELQEILESGNLTFKKSERT